MVEGNIELLEKQTKPAKRKVCKFYEHKFQASKKFIYC